MAERNRRDGVVYYVRTRARGGPAPCADKDLANAIGRLWARRGMGRSGVRPVERAPRRVPTGPPRPRRARGDCPRKWRAPRRGHRRVERPASR